ncbi:hypothetical protein [Allokutzneria oryzae]|uniref:ESX-1 secretion-associated protein n=1 Tax=Allokutzneria oryzae TaxID=1378989 RepID=A0ABV5ZZL0_9PSEU
MDGYQVKPDSLLGYADGSESLADKFDQLERLLHQAKVDDQCFGPLGDALGISHSYFKLLDECKELTKGAGGYLRHTAAGLHQTHAIYKGTETGLSQGFDALGKGADGERA